jgi:Serpin (serine protease inhibitor)
MTRHDTASLSRHFKTQRISTMRLPLFHYVMRAALVAPFFAVSLPAGAEQGAADTKPSTKSEAPSGNTTCGLQITSNVPAQPAPPPQEQASFALELLSEVAADGKSNVAVSPFRVSAVLGVLDIGADLKMKAAIAHVLHVGEKSDKGIDHLRKNARLLAVMAAKQNSSFASADALFVDQALPLKPGIEDQVWAEGGIKLEKLNFASLEAIAEVNSWVARHTRDRIKSILEPGTVPALVAVAESSESSSLMRLGRIGHPAPGF